MKSEGLEDQPGFTPATLLLPGAAISPEQVETPQDKRSPLSGWMETLIRFRSNSCHLKPRFCSGRCFKLLRFGDETWAD